MRWSQYFIPTLREVPADAEVVSHRLLLRAGMVRQLAAGVYSLLPLAQRVSLKIQQILREEMNRIGGQEFFLPALNPREIWEESGRWTVMGDNMFRLKDRKGADMCLGMTHEEVFTSIARNEIRSYKQLPQVWYQIQIKFRDEARPKSGVLRVRQFIMKDAYSFDLDQTGQDKSFEDQREAYKRIFDRCGLKYTIVEASSGAMGGSASNEFMVRTDAGEDLIATCEHCGYAANLEKATSRLPEVKDGIGLDAPVEFPTPGVRTIEDLTTFPGGATADRQIKTLVYVATRDGEQEFVLALLRGDHQLHETKLSDALAGAEVRAAQAEEIRDLLGAGAGSLGGVGAKARAREKGREVRILADLALKNRRNMTTGANKDDHHLRGVQLSRDIPVDKWVDLRTVASGEGCPNCGEGVLEVAKSLEIGHIFKLGTKYSESMGARVLTQDGQRGADCHGQLRHRRRAHHGLSHRASPRRGRHHLAQGNRALRLRHHHHQHEAGRDTRGRGKALPRLAARGPGRAPGRPRGARRRQVQGRGFNRHPLPHHRRQEGRGRLSRTLRPAPRSRPRT